MKCPNCGHNLKNEDCHPFPISSNRTKFMAICDRCKRLVNFIVYKDDSGNVNCYSWESIKEIKYAKMISEISEKKYVLFFHPETEQSKILDIARNFGNAHGGGTAFIFPELFLKEADLISQTYSVIVLPKVLFPETTSYLAEKLIIENTEGELFSTKQTIHKKFQIL